VDLIPCGHDILPEVCHACNRGNRKAGQALLDTAEVHLRAHGATEIQALPQEHRYPFYMLKAACLSERMDLRTAAETTRTQVADCRP